MVLLINSCLKFALREQNLSFVNPRTSMTFHPHPGVTLTFSVSSDTTFFCHPSIYSNFLEASCFLAKWLPVHGQQQFADFSGPLGSNSPSSIFVKYSPPPLVFAGNILYWTQLNSASCSWRCLIFCCCSSITPIYCVSTLIFCKGGVHSQSADTADADVDDNIAIVLESFGFSCPPAIVDEQCKVIVVCCLRNWWRTLGNYT